MKRILLFASCCPYLLGLFLSTPARGQSAQEQAEYVPTPQTWSFMRYGATPVDYYTGTARVDVPLYTYSDNDFDIPVSASYASTGFQPQRQTGILGLNWFLNCGGSITREVRGLPDDHSHNGCGGFIAAEGAMFSDQHLFNFNMENCGMSEHLDRYVVGGRETESDLYYFNFLGHSGRFHFNGCGEICVYGTDGSHGTYEITPNREDGHISGFTVRTADGYKYVFGGDNSAVERHVKGNFGNEGQFVFERDPLFDGESQYPIVTWNLKEIVAPNGRRVTFTYKPVELLSNVNPIDRTTNNPFYVMTFAVGPNEVIEDGSNCEHMRHVSVVRTSYLDRIDVEDCKVKIAFDYGRKGCCDVDKGLSDNIPETMVGDARIVQDLYRLDTMTVTSDNGQIRQCTFSYSIKDNRTLLASINLHELGSYRMSYYQSKPFAGLTTSDVDFWGYQNGTGNSYNAYCPMIIDQDCNENINPTETFNNPDWKYALSGCLKRITYPTRGYTEFAYEANRAKYIILRRKRILYASDDRLPIELDSISSAENTTPYLARLHSYKSFFNGSDLTGGVRIRRITDCDAYGEPVIREFEYDTGIVSSFPRYQLEYSPSFQFRNPYLNIPSSTFDRVHIGYSSVKEILSDGSYTEYRYTDYLQYPDEPEDQNRAQIADSADTHLPLDYINNIMRQPNSRHYRRGKLRSVGYYDASHNRVRIERMKYAEHNAGEEVDYSTYVTLSGIYAYSVKLYTGDYRLVEKRSTDYFGSDSISTVTRYAYNDLGQINSQTVIAPDNSIRQTLTTYYHETRPQSDFTSHILDYPASVRSIYADSFYATPPMRYITSAAEYEYDNSCGVLKPHRVKQALLDEPAVSTRLSQLEYRTAVQYQARDSHGNPTQIEDAAGVVTCYIWGYGGRYPVLRAAGTTYEALKAALSISGNDPLGGALSAAQEAAVRQITGIYVDTYDYKPCVGMTRHTDVAGRTYTYMYDTAGRLIRTDDPMGRLQEYNYYLGINTNLEIISEPISESENL